MIFLTKPANSLFHFKIQSESGDLLKTQFQLERKIQKRLSSSFFIIYVILLLILSVFYVSLSRIDSHSLLYDCTVGSLL